MSRLVSPGVMPWGFSSFAESLEDAKAAFVICDPTTTAPDRRRLFRVIEGGKG